MEIQKGYGYLPRERLEELSEKYGVPKGLLFSVVTFYHRLSLYPRGKVCVEVCLGTACHVKGGRRLEEALVRSFSLKEAELGGRFFREDHLVSVEEVRCFGCCSLAPVVRIGDEILGRVGEEELVERVEREVKRALGEGKEETS